MSDDGKLDPCPFCGGGGEYQTDTEEAGFSEEWIGCTSCGATTAIEVWNRRTPPPAGAGEVVVKPLEWREEGDEDDVWALVALGLSCRYEVFHRASDVAKIGVQVARSVPTEDGGQNADILGYGKTVAEAKAIAQADYEQRLVSAIELSGNSGELPVPTNTVGGEVAAETIKRYAWQRLPGSTSLLPVVRDDGDWVKFSDVVDICAANQRLRRSPDTTSRDSAPDLHEQADELWMKLMPTMQTSSWEDGSRDVYADKVAALALIEEALAEATNA